MMLNLKDMMKYYVEHRFEVITRRTQYELRGSRKTGAYSGRSV